MENTLLWRQNGFSMLTFNFFHGRTSGRRKINSTFTTHVVSSSGTDTYSAVAASLSSLKGPRHGGANLKVMEMFENIEENVTNWEDENELRTYLTKIA